VPTVAFLKKLLQLSLLLRNEGAKILAVFESFVYRIAADWALSKLASKVENCHHLQARHQSRVTII
jgi:hypothetical protein